LRELIAHYGDSSERRGLLGGRYKQKWIRGGNPADLDRAIAEYEAGMRLDLNDYYPSSNLARLYRTRKRKGDEHKARVAAAIALTACERAKQRKSQDEWLNPTLLGAAFDSGDLEKAQQLADSVALEGPAHWKLETTLSDCKLAAQLFEEPRRAQLLAIAGQLSSLV
jgi:hypothetical protein